MGYFSPTGGSVATGGGIPLGAASATTTALAIPLANTTVSYTFPTNTTSILCKLREYGADVRFGYSVGVFAGATYHTIPRGTHFSVDQFSLTASLTIYFQVTAPGQTLEIHYQSS